MNKFKNENIKYSNFNPKDNSSRHFLPAIKEWKNSVYSYNKNYLKETISKDINLNRLIKSYFNLSLTNTEDTKSKRMRNLIKRSSTKKIFVSKSEIKQTSDKYIITVYLHDRKNYLLKKRLYLIYKSINRNNSIFKENNFFKNQLFTYKKNLSKSEYLYKLNSVNLNKLIKTKKLFRRKNRLLHKSMNKQKIEYNILPKYILPNILRKRIWLKEFFSFLFLKWCLDIIGITVKENIWCNRCEKRINNLSRKTSSSVVYCTYCNNKLSYKLNMFDLYKKGKLISTLRISSPISILLLNYKMKNLLQKHYSTIMFNFNIDKNIGNLLKKYIDITYKNFVYHFFLRELKVLKILSHLNLNRFKLGNFIPYIKQLSNNIYNKTSEFNLINLKYLHLNADNLLEGISIKLNKRKSKLIKILGKSLKLVKKPKKLNSNFNYNKNLSKLEKSNVNINLTSVRYKWIIGIKLEAKGRLTKRFTASRALFKYVNKGSLKNMENLYKSKFDLNSPSVYVSRRQFRPNLEHSYIYSNKRIGTFGLKGWLNSI